MRKRAQRRFPFVDSGTPAGWRCVTSKRDGMGYRREGDGATVIVSLGRELDGQEWIHLSMAYPGRLPTWEDLVAARDAFLGPGAKCIQVIPPATEHVNIHSFCLHLWHCVDGDPLPDFTGGTRSI